MGLSLATSIGTERQSAAELFGLRWEGIVFDEDIEVASEFDLLGLSWFLIHFSNLNINVIKIINMKVFIQ